MKTADQVDQMKKATELNWRPFLDINPRNEAIAVGALCGESDTSALQPLDIQTVGLNTVEYMALRYIGFVAKTDFTFRNTGKTPLRFLRNKFYTLSLVDWENEFHKSPDSLAAYLRDGCGVYETDVVILPESTFASNGGFLSKAKLGKAAFEKERAKKEKERRLVFYYAYYLEYEDFFDHTYNLLFMRFFPFRFDIRNDSIFFDEDIQGGIERYRWDIWPASMAGGLRP